MADLLKMDPARLERLRDPARIEMVNPERVLDVVSPPGDGVMVDLGAGVGFVSLPFARRFPDLRIVACDLLPGMLDLLAETAREEGLKNLQTSEMPDPVSLALDQNCAGLLIMLQVHHELDSPVELLRECRRVLMPGAPVVIVDWKDEDVPGMPKGGRRVPQSVIAGHLSESGFEGVTSHDLYRCHSTTIGVTPE